MRTILVIAGSLTQANQWINNQPRMQGVRYSYVASKASIISVPDGTTYVLVGTYYEHPHMSNIMDEVDIRQLKHE